MPAIAANSSSIAIEREAFLFDIRYRSFHIKVYSVNYMMTVRNKYRVTSEFPEYNNIAEELTAGFR